MEEEAANHPPSPQQELRHCITQYISNEDDEHTSNPPSSPEDDRSISNLSVGPNVHHSPPALPPPRVERSTATANPVVSPSVTTDPPPSKPPPSSSSSTNKNTDWAILYKNTKSSAPTKPQAKRHTNRNQFH